MWRLLFNVLTITIRIDPTSLSTLTRLVNLLEGTQQSQIDELVARLHDSSTRLATTIDLTTPKENK